MMTLKLAVFGNKNATNVLVQYLIQNNLKPSCVITLDNEKKIYSKISGVDFLLEEYCNKIGIKVFTPSKYTLNASKDIQYFLNEEFDLGLCVGWQRLLPQEILDTFKHGVYGWHGSMFKFPDGRGRSPLNWSMRLGANKVYHNLFKYDKHADAGPIFETKTIIINPDHLIQDVVGNATKHICQSSVRLLNCVENDAIKLSTQSEGAVVYFGKLTEADGWLQPYLMTTDRCKNIIRATSRPFPGAYLLHNGQLAVKVWNITFERNKALKPGYVYFDDDILGFGTLDGSVFCTDFEIIDRNLVDRKETVFRIC